MPTKRGRPPVRRQPKTGKPTRACAQRRAQRAALGVDQVSGGVFRLIAWGSTSSAPAGADPRAVGQVVRGGLDDVFEDVGVIEPQGFASGVVAGAIGALLSVGDSGDQAALVSPSTPGDRPTYIAGTDRAVVISTPHESRVYLDDAGNIELGTQAALNIEPTENKGGRLRLSSAGDSELFGTSSAVVWSAPEGLATFSQLECNPGGGATLSNHQTAAVVLRVAPDSVQVQGPDLFLEQGIGVGSWISQLHQAFVDWTPAAQDGGAALKLELAPLLLQPPPSGS